MRESWIVVGCLVLLGLGAIAWFLSARRAEASGDLIAGVRREVQASGWQLMLIRDDEGGPGFLFTIGLWHTYRHPEILLFAPSADPSTMAGRVRPLVDRIRNGERFAAGKLYEGVFDRYPGWFREIDARWYPLFLGTAGAFYDSFDFPALQLFWPDRESRFPWQSEFDRGLFPLQPILGERNAILANLPDSELAAMRREGLAPFWDALRELLVEPDVPADRSELLLEEWRSLVGADSKVLGVTVFGDLLVRQADGSVALLDTGRGTVVAVSADRDEWPVEIARRPETFLHAPVLLALRSLDYSLAPGEVYEFRIEPMLGGTETLDNIQKAPASVHVSHSGRVARALEDVPPGAPIQHVEFTPVGPRGPVVDPAAVFEVVVNDEEQYSIWPAGEAIPAGWKSVGVRGTKDECLDHIERVWTDLRPKSLREQLEPKDGAPR